MDVYEAIETRRSVRAFEQKPVSRETVERLLGAAVRAPTAGNLQPWRFVVVRDRALRQELVGAARGQGFVGQAPVVIVVCVDTAVAMRGYGARGVELYCLQDAAAATQNLMLAAVAEGLGTCWVGAFDEAKAASALGLDVHWRPVALVPVGYPATEGRRRGRLPLDQVVSYA